MIVSYQWLQEYVDFDLPPAELADVLTDLGLEANLVSQFPDYYESVRVGHILEVTAHPNADRLRICKVDLGTGEPQQIICGAPNVAAGQKAPVATIGTTFPNGITIKRAKMRGEISNGMICSEDELELSKDHTGIMVLDDAAQTGESLREYLSGGDVAIEIDLTPNRPDALGHIGVARDLGAVLQTSLKMPELNLEEGRTETSERIQVRIEDTDACPRYAARVVEGVKIGPSPRWLAQRLEAVGIRSINNVVDASNYVLMETGHPLHTFDLRDVKGNTIIVRKAHSGEKMTTLDGKERELKDHMLLICDAERPVALAGIMGGENSEVRDDTTDILIESAYFDPVTIRRGSKDLQLSTEASHRFERGTDPNGLIFALDRLASLIRKFAGGTIRKGRADVYPNVREAEVVPFRPEKCNAVLGTRIETDEMKRILEALELRPDTRGAEAWRVTIPTFRPDITREIDLIEEVGRVHGYNKIPVPAHFRIASKIQKEGQDVFREAVMDHLAARGYLQTYSNSLVGPGDHPQILGGESAVLLANPLTQEMASVRSSLYPNLTAILKHNQNHRQKNLSLFEIGQVSSLDMDSETGAREATHLALACTGYETEKQWLQDADITTVYHLKGQISELFYSFQLSELWFEPKEHELLDTASEIKFGEEILGVLGELSPAEIKRLDLEGPVIYAEFRLPRMTPTSGKRYAKMSVFPSIERDMSVLVGAEVPYADIQAVIDKNAGKYLIHSRLYDLFEGKSIARGQKSLTFRMVFQNRKRTLTEKEVERDFNRVLRALETTFNAKLREA